MVISGIYTITNLINNKIYVGYTCNFENRKTNHINLLRGNYHSNSLLQRAWNKYGESNFRIEILEEVDREFLASQENYWSNLLRVTNKKYGYNLRPTHPTGKSPLSEETKLKIGQANSNKKWSEEHKEKMKTIFKNSSKRKEANIKTGILKRDKGHITLVYNKEGKFLKEFSTCRKAALEYGVDESSVRKCCKGVFKSAGGLTFKYKA